MSQLLTPKDIISMRQNGSTDALKDAMFDALVDNDVDSVRILLENGVSVYKFLTIERLEQLYNAERGPPHTLVYIVGDVVKVHSNYSYTLPDVGLAVEKLMDNGFRFYYTGSEFTEAYNQAQKDSVRISINGKAVFEQQNAEEYVFKYPYSDLLIWAVLTKRYEMALCMWEYGEEALAKSLIASKLFKSLADEAAEDYLKVEVCEELKKYAEKFQNLSVELLECSYKHSDVQTLQLLTYELKYWSKETCLSLAASSDNKAFVAHPCCQVLLADLWHGGMRLRNSSNLKVVLGLLFPPSIFFFEFKSRKELFQQPHTAFEHDDDVNEAFSSGSDSDGSLFSSDSDADDPDSHSVDLFASSAARRSARSAKLNTFLRIFRPLRQTSLPNDSAATVMPETKSQRSPVTDLLESQSLLDLTTNNHRPNAKDNHTEKPLKRRFKRTLLQQQIIRKHPIRVRRKLYEFFVAPITTFWSWFLSYLIFLSVLTYVLLIRTPVNPTFSEYVLVCYVITFGIELIRKLIMSKPQRFHEKLEYFFGFWNTLTMMAVVSHFIGFLCRTMYSNPAYGRCILSLSAVLWTIKMLDFLSVHPNIGPLVTMAGNMITSMTYVTVMLCVSLLAFGLARQSINFPNEDWHWILLRNIFYKPYFMSYGEVYAKTNLSELCITTDFTNGIDICNDQIWECHQRMGIPLSEAEETLRKTCVTGHWIPPFLMVFFCLISNVLLTSMLVAIFDHIFKETDKMSQQIWMFQRYHQVMQYEATPFVPPPFTWIYHIYMLVKYVRHWRLIRIGYRSNSPFDFSLKLFLNTEELEDLHDFEEECMEDFAREKEYEKHGTDEERLYRSAERTKLILRRINNLVMRKGRVRTKVDLLEGRIEQLDSCQNEIVDCLKQITSAVPTILNRIQSRSMASTSNNVRMSTKTAKT
uniref:Ion_trans domain-containing protein n=1 Tax=Panagrellus redivivus TaxID=6233 RepID=A0A7E4VYS8_PANRE